MICPNCLFEIDEESSYCDQCGSKILICSVCGKTGKGNYCSNDKSLLVHNNETKNFVEKNFYKTQKDDKKNKTVLTKRLRLINKTLNLTLEVNDGDIIGRKTGKFISQLADHKQISAKQCEINCTIDNGWTVKEYGSTNGTKLNGSLLEAMVAHKINNADTLTLANIEFHVMITD